MAQRITSPLNKAQECASSLHAIENLLAQASDGSDNLSLVSPNHLSLLLSSILEELDASLDELEKRPSRPRLRTI